jgi:serine protease Do
MNVGPALRAAAASAVILLYSAMLSATAAQEAQPPEGGQTQTEPPQAAPEGQPPEAAPEGAPPPILPAPSLPLEDPVVELPPATGPAPQAGIPLDSSGQPFNFADLAERLLDSVVYISTSQRVSIARNAPVPELPKPPSDEMFEDFFDDGPGESDPRMVQSLGSGFVIDATGLIVTNNHVIADADEIVANFADGKKLKATVLGVDDKTDLALLKVEPTAPLKVAQFGRSEGLRVGEWVLAIGNPFGFGGSVTAGIVSALDRDINSGPYDHYIQTDASINRGNSGGPLFNIGGEVVGINTAIMSPTGGSIGIGFAVPSEIAVPVIQQLREFGEVRRGWIGVRIQEVTDDFAEGLGLDQAMGALIAGLNEGGPAEKAGIKAGDVVVEFNGKPVEAMRMLPRLVADTPPGETVDLVVVRDGERVTLKIEVGLLGEDQVKTAAATTGEPEAADGDKPPAADAAAMFGLSLGPITDEARRAHDIDTTVEGVLVTEVAPGSEAEEKALKVGDVILQVTQKAVADTAALEKRVEELKKEGRRTVMLLVSGAQNKLRFVSLRFAEAQ